MGIIEIPVEIGPGDLKEKSQIIKMKVDTGSGITFVDEKICKEMGFDSYGKVWAKGLEEIPRKYNQYRAVLKIEGCHLPISFPVAGNPEGVNLLGHDILQSLQAQIDEKEHKLICPIQI